MFADQRCKMLIFCALLPQTIFFFFYGKHSQLDSLTIFDKGLHIFPYVEAQTTNMSAHDQKGLVVRKGRLLIGPLGSTAETGINQQNATGTWLGGYF